MTIKFAGKLNAFSRGPRGFFVKLEIGADDDWEDLAKSPLGMTFGVVMVPIDPETGVRTDASPGAETPSASPDTGQLSAEAGKADKPKVPWIKMPRAQRAGILCNDTRFQIWATDRVQAEINPETWPGDPKESAAMYIRWRCGVKSRAELDNTDEIATRFDLMESIFRQDNGLMAEVR